MDIEVSNVTVGLTRGDIARQADVDTVVNAANAELRIGGGVAGALHRAAGPALEDACREHAPISPGEAVITDAFELPNRRVVHCLGPVYGRDEPSGELLAHCYREALSLADEDGSESIAFPAISTGAFGFPMDEAAEIAVRTVLEVAPELQNIRHVRFVLFSERALDEHRRALERAGAEAEKEEREGSGSGDSPSR
ncbi:MAG: macro domain-containing protein [Gemmatimonadota bacterium]